jgi:MSHA biogenesis protein MshO
MAAEFQIRGQRGFTLIEAIVVIVITGVIAAMISTFIRAPVDAYADTVRRALLTDTADTMLRRVARDVHTALPNSLRPPTVGSACIEFIPTVAGGRYRAAPSSIGGGNVLSFTAPPGIFDVLASLGRTITTADLLVIYNLGISGADAYSGGTTSTITAVGSANSTITPGRTTAFVFESPGHRFQIIPTTATVYLCDSAGTSAGNGTGSLVRYTRAIDPSPLASCPAAPVGAAILARNLTTCSFSYTPGVTARSGLLSVQLGLTQGGESVTLYEEVHVDNVP